MKKNSGLIKNLPLSFSTCAELLFLQGPWASTLPISKSFYNMSLVHGVSHPKPSKHLYN